MFEDLVLGLSFFKVRVQLLGPLLGIGLLIDSILKSLLLIGQLGLKLLGLLPEHFMVLKCLDDRVMKTLELLLIYLALICGNFALLV
jgi:hypothetical protein